MVMGKDSVNFMRFVFADLSDGHWHAETALLLCPSVNSVTSFPYLLKKIMSDEKHIHSYDSECSCHSHEGECSCHSHEGECSCHEPVQRKHIATPGFKAQEPDKGVSLGPEVEQEIAQVLKKRYARFLDGTESFSVKTEVCHQFGLVSAVLTNPEHTTYVCVETSVECEENQIDNPMDAYDKALDVMDLVWLDYFDSDRISHYLPIWQAYEIDSMSVNVRLEHSNPSLDDEASEFLKAHGFLEGGLSPEDYADDEFEEGDED